jgi:hypothetical protein
MAQPKAGQKDTENISSMSLSLHMMLLMFAVVPSGIRSLSEMIEIEQYSQCAENRCADDVTGRRISHCEMDREGRSKTEIECQDMLGCHRMPSGVKEKRYLRETGGATEWRARLVGTRSDAKLPNDAVRR